MSRLKKEVIIQKSDKDNSVVLVNKPDYIRHIEGILKDINKCEKVSLKKGILNFAVNHEEHINKQLKGISKNGCLTKQQYKKVKAVGRNPGILYGLCKVHKTVVDPCPPFRHILSAIGTPTYKLAIYLVTKLASINANEIYIKDSFCFEEEIVNQNINFIMGGLDVDSLFSIIPLMTHSSKKQIFMRVGVNKKTGLQWGRLCVQLWPKPFYHIMKKNGLKYVPRKSNF